MSVIDDLKQNKEAFILMSKAMREKAEKVGAPEFEFLNYSGKWEERTSDDFNSNSTYRLRSDYQEEEGVVKCEVYEKGIGTGGLWYTLKGQGDCELNEACCDPDFIGSLSDGWLSGRIYRSKADKDYTTLIIPIADLDQYEVLTPKIVLFRRLKCLTE